LGQIGLMYEKRSCCLVLISTRLQFIQVIYQSNGDLTFSAMFTTSKACTSSWDTYFDTEL